MESCQSSDELVAAIVEWLRAVADESRVRILFRLKKGECNVSTLVEELGIGQASVSKHLGVLRRARILVSRREGANVFYRINGDVPLEVCSILCRNCVEERRRLHEAVALGDPFEH